MINDVGSGSFLDELLLLKELVGTLVRLGGVTYRKLQLCG